MQTMEMLDIIDSIDNVRRSVNGIAAATNVIDCSGEASEQAAFHEFATRVLWDCVDTLYDVSHALSDEVQANIKKEPATEE